MYNLVKLILCAVVLNRVIFNEITLFRAFQLNFSRGSKARTEITSVNYWQFQCDRFKHAQNRKDMKATNLRKVAARL